MPVFQAYIQRMVGLNNSRKTSVNIHRNSNPNRPGFSTWNITPNVETQTGFSPSELDPSVSDIYYDNLLTENFRDVILENGDKLKLERDARELIGQHTGMFIQSDFHSPILKTVEAPTSAVAKALFIALYGPGSIKSSIEQVS